MPRLSRRSALKLGAASGALPLVHIRTGRAAGKVSIAFWDHWVPDANEVMKKQCEAFGKKHQVEVQADFITSVGSKNILTIAAERQAKVGHDSKKPADGQYNGYGFHDGPVPLRPLVKVHPETGRKNLVIGRHAHNIPGMDKQESERFLKELADFATGDPRRVYHHDWRVGDAVLWDNRRLLHRATPWDYKQRRVMWHSRIAGDPVTEAGLAA